MRLANRLIIASSLTFIVLISCSVLLPKVNAVPVADLTSRQDNGASVNKGTITLAGTVYALPSGFFEVPSGDFQIIYNPEAGFRFVKWETEGAISLDDPSSPITNAHMQTETGEVTIRAVYGALAPVGGVALPTNKLEILTPYLALAGLVIAVSAVVVLKRRKD